MGYPYDSRTTMVEGSSFSVSFLSVLGNGVTELIEDVSSSSGSSESSEPSESDESDESD